MRGGAAKALKFLGWTYVVYLLFSLLILLPALNIAAPWAVREFLNRELEHELIVFNPFTLSVELRGARVLEKDGHVPLALGKARVDLSLQSVWQEGIVLDELRVENLDLHVLRYADGNFHFSDLLAAEEDTASEASPVPSVTIHDIYVGAHTLRFTDRTRQGTDGAAYSAAYSDFSIETSDITTLPGRRGDGELAVRGADGGTLRWTGDIAIADGRSEGRLGIEQLDLTHIWEYEAERLPFVVNSALLDISLEYSVAWLDELRFTVNDGSVRLHDVSMLPVDAARLADTAVGLTEFVVSGIDVDSKKSRVQIADLAINGLNVEGFDQGDRLSLLEMLVPAEASDAAPTPAAEDKASAEDGAQWQFGVARAALENSRIVWRSERLTPQPLIVSPIDIEVGDIGWPATTDSPVTLALGLNDSSTLQVDGKINIDSGDGDFHSVLSALPLAWFNPLLATSVRADVEDGLLNVDAQATLEAFAPATIAADVALSSFVMQIHGEKESALAFETLALQRLAVDIVNSIASVDDISLISLRGAALILQNGDLNITTAMVEPEADEAEPATESPDAGVEIAGDDQPWTVRIGHIGIRDGQLNFSDASLPLPFETLIGDIEADINDLDSSAEQPLVATLNGAVDGYAPVVIEARGRPLGNPRDASMTLRFRGMDIASMSPYSGTYAGYAIDSGTLSIDVGYALQGTEIAGENRIIISQMELGEQIESDRAMQLPLKLGLALLTDANGVIDLDVPISGDVDDPKFSLARVIGGAIANVIIKAATAPFRLLAGLVNSDEDLENIPFAAGNARLSEQGASALSALATALQQRPKLQLRIVGSTEPAADRRALQAQALNNSLIEQGLSAEAIEAMTDAYRSAVDARYAALQLPMSGEDGELTLEAKLNALQSRIELPTGTLQDLGTERAVEAKRQLVNVGEIDAGRIAVSYDKSLLISGVTMSLGG